MIEQSTLLTLLPVRLDIDRPQTSADACRLTAADADANISVSAHLCKWCLSTEIKWH